MSCSYQWPILMFVIWIIDSEAINTRFQLTRSKIDAIEYTKYKRVLFSNGTVTLFILVGKCYEWKLFVWEVMFKHFPDGCSKLRCKICTTWPYVRAAVYTSVITNSSHHKMYKPVNLRLCTCWVGSRCSLPKYKVFTVQWGEKRYENNGNYWNMKNGGMVFVIVGLNNKRRVKLSVIL